MGCVYLLCKLFELDDQLVYSLLPKSVTTAIAMPLATMTGGIDSLLVAATSVTGILCAVIAPLLVKLFRFRNPVAAGIAIGSSGHAVGTSTAIKLGPVQGATSGIAIGLSGLFTVLIYSILFRV
jgi:putative effector of murein hydrolase